MKHSKTWVWALLFLMVIPAQIFASEYTLDEAFHNRDKNQFAGILTRCGYSYADNLFTYGVSVFYQWPSGFGITGGFDGYYGNLHTEEAYNKALPLWDARLGFCGKHFGIGAIYGQCTACHHSGTHRGTIRLNNNGDFIGGFATFICPLSTHFGLNIDVAYTTHTSFNISAGILIRFPIKK